MRTLIEDRDTILQLTAKIHEPQNEVNCMNDSRDFKDAESVRSGPSHVSSQPAFFPPFQGRQVFWDTQGISGDVFANPAASSSAPYPQ